MVTSILAGPRIPDVLFFCTLGYLFTDGVVGNVTDVFRGRSKLLSTAGLVLGTSAVYVEVIVPDSVTAIDSVV